MKLKKVFALTLAACLSASLVAGCSSSGSSGSSNSGEKVVKIGVFEPTTGENGGGGFQEVLGVRYANQVHPTVKIGGEDYKVVLVEVDNKSDKTEAVNAAQKLVSQKVSAVIGSYGSVFPLPPDRSLQMPRFRQSALPVRIHRLPREMTITSVYAS